MLYGAPLLRYYAEGEGGLAWPQVFTVSGTLNYRLYCGSKKEINTIYVRSKVDN